MSTPNPFPTETEEQVEGAGLNGAWNPWQGPAKPGFWSGAGFSEENPLGPLESMALKPLGQATAAGELLLAGAAHRVNSFAGRLLGNEPVVGAFLKDQEQRSAALEQDATARLKALTPDPQTTGTAVQTVAGLVSGGYRAALGTVLGGPLGGAALLGSTEAATRFHELRAKGVDEGTAAESAGLTGVVSGIGAMIPGGFGSGLFAKVATGAAANVALGAGARFADHKILEAAGYKDMADQERVWDGVGMVTDALLGGAFGGLAHLHAAAEAGRSQDGAPSALDEAGARDAAMVARLAVADRQAAPGVPVDPASQAAHQAALESAVTSLLQDEPVDVAHTGIQDATMLERPEDPSAELGRQVIAEAFRNANVQGAEQRLADLEAAFAARLRGEKPTEPVQTPAPAFEPRRPEESEEEFAARLKAYAKANIDTRTMPDMGRMAKDWQPYFAHGGDAVVPIEELDFGAKPQEGREQMGVKRMAAAANGEIPKREPLQVALGADGRLRVVDGKSTLGALRQVGVTHAPIELVHSEGSAAEELKHLEPEAGRKLARMYVGANEALPDFRTRLEGLAQATDTRARVAPLKGLKRAVEKTRLDYVGNPSKMKDLLRGAIEIDSVDEAMRVADAIGQHFEVLPEGQRNLLDPKAPAPADGYRDAKFNVRLPNGTIGEIQLHVPELYAAKEEGGGHVLYEERRPLDAKPGRLTPEEQARYDELNAKMRALYEPLWAEVMRRSKASRETSAPLRETEPRVNGRGGEVSNARQSEPPSGSGVMATGMPSTSKNLEPAGNEPTALTALRDLPATGAPPASSIPRAAHTVMTATGRRIEVTPRVVELGDLITSDHPEYPQELQPRQRGARAALTEQVRGIARNLNPELLGNAPEADRGAPITGPGNIVESGNGRAFALREVYANHPEKAAEYRAFLERQGYDVAGMKEPVLVRERVTPLEGAERRAFTVEANQTSVAALSPVERAQADARLLDASALSQLRNGELYQAQNAPFVRSFLERLPEAERNELLNPDGTISQAGVRRLQAAVLAKAYGGAPESNAVLGRMLESTDNDLRSTMGAMLDAAPAFARLRQAIEEGKIGPEYDLSKAITQAVETVAQMREKGQALGEFLKQGDFLTRRPAVVDALMKALYDRKGERIAAREKVATRLMNYADRAIKQRLDQGMLFGDPPVPPEQLLAADEGTAESPEPKPGADMFGLRTPQGKPPPTTGPAAAAAQALERNPNLEIPDESGEAQRARAELMAADEGVAKVEERAKPATDAAATCFGSRAA